LFLCPRPIIAVDHQKFSFRHSVGVIALQKLLKSLRAWLTARFCICGEACLDTTVGESFRQNRTA
jgi:hypothetical protein